MLRLRESRALENGLVAFSFSENELGAEVARGNFFQIAFCDWASLWILGWKSLREIPLFSDVWQTKDFKSNVFGSVASKGVSDAFCVSVAGNRLS